MRVQGIISSGFSVNGFRSLILRNAFRRFHFAARGKRDLNRGRRVSTSIPGNLVALACSMRMQGIIFSGFNVSNFSSLNSLNAR